MATRHKRHGKRRPAQGQSGRRSRERAIVGATRALWDERGSQTASIEEIASAVGLARGLMYRQFSSKEELFVLTTAEYLDELHELLATAAACDEAPERQLDRLTEAYGGYCRRYPAYLDCSSALVQRPAGDLHELVSDAIWLRLGQSMARCLEVLAGVLRAGNESGVFEVEDVDYTANVLWTQMQGVMALARLGVGVRQAAPDVPALFTVEPERLVATCVSNARLIVGMDAARK